jgi:uncharacterized protein (DUF697 family)
MGHLALNQPTCVFGLEDRNRRAKEIITKYAKMHAAMDVGIGLTALIPIPGAATAAVIAAILAQAPLVYKPMTAELATVYSATVTAEATRLSHNAIAIGTATDIAAEIGSEFLREIAGELIGEAAVGLGASALPFIGALFAAGVDAAVSATLTWRVGTMVSLYFQNGEEWLRTRKDTYHVAKEFVGGYSPRVENRSNLDGLGRIPVIQRKQLDFVLNLIDMLRATTATREQIRTALKNKSVPEHLVQEALRVAFA